MSLPLKWESSPQLSFPCKRDSTPQCHSCESRNPKRMDTRFRGYDSKGEMDARIRKHDKNRT